MAVLTCPSCHRTWHVAGISEITGYCVACGDYVGVYEQEKCARMQWEDEHYTEQRNYILENPSIHEFTSLSPVERGELQ